jgi:AAA domain, putative AbiEii toxin, Type IV TA system
LLSTGEQQPETRQYWTNLVEQVKSLFGIVLNPPAYNEANGIIEMTYTENKVELDLSAAGRGMLQVILLLAYLYNNPKTVLLLDEPDAHLEILRQRQVYQLISEVAQTQGSQVIAASHSEVLMQEAAGKHVLIALYPYSKPQRIDSNTPEGNRALDKFEKALSLIPSVDYYQALQRGWVLFLEGSTDLAILQAWANRLNHQKAKDALTNPFVYYIQSNEPRKAREHFYRLRAAAPLLRGVAIFDQIDKELSKEPLEILKWRKREIENYLCYPEALIGWLMKKYEGVPLFRDSHQSKMEEIIQDRMPRAAYRDRTDQWWTDVKATDQFLDPVFDAFFQAIAEPNQFLKKSYYELAQFVPLEMIDPEVTEKLDAIAEVAGNAKPLVE